MACSKVGCVLTDEIAHCQDIYPIERILQDQRLFYRETPNKDKPNISGKSIFLIYFLEKNSKRTGIIPQNITLFIFTIY